MCLCAFCCNLFVQVRSGSGPAALVAPKIDPEKRIKLKLKKKNLRNWVLLLDNIGEGWNKEIRVFGSREYWNSEIWVQSLADRRRRKESLKISFNIWCDGKGIGNCQSSALLNVASFFKQMLFQGSFSLFLGPLFLEFCFFFFISVSLSLFYIYLVFLRVNHPNGIN